MHDDALKGRRIPILEARCAFHARYAVFTGGLLVRVLLLVREDRRASRNPGKMLAGGRVLPRYSMGVVMRTHREGRGESTPEVNQGQARRSVIHLSNYHTQ